MNRSQRHKTAREVVFGAPVAGLLWLLLIRLFTGIWSFGFPLTIVGVSVVLGTLMLLPNPAGSFAHGLWRGLIRIIDWLVTRIVCLILFYLIFTPLGLVLRLFRVRLLDLKRSPGRTSYWTKIPDKQLKPEHFFKQY